MTIVDIMLEIHNPNGSIDIKHYDTFRYDWDDVVEIAKAQSFPYQLRMTTTKVLTSDRKIS
jgi:hypothetical protein